MLTVKEKVTAVLKAATLKKVAGKCVSMKPKKKREAVHNQSRPAEGTGYGQRDEYTH